MSKKIFFGLLFITFVAFITGCEMGNTPSSKVEELFMKYQKIDDDITLGINDVLMEENITDEHKDRYRKILEKQYRNLSYEIKDEFIDGDNANVIVEIEVMDYKKAVNDLVFDSSVYTKESYDNEKLNRLENVTDKVTYTLELTLFLNEDGNWKLNALTNDEIKKIQGMY